MPNPLIVFIDSNILFSTCYRSPNLFERLWQITTVRVVTAPYCLVEVRRHVHSPEQLVRLDILLAQTVIVDDCPESELPNTLMLHAKDVPVLAAAARRKADILITGDKNHFSRYFGHRVMGVLIESPAMFRERFPDAFVR